MFPPHVNLNNSDVFVGLEENSVMPCALHQVQFEVADATKRTFPEGSFDVIYSRDTILHIDDKLSLFKRFHVSFFSYLAPLQAFIWLCMERKFKQILQNTQKQKAATGVFMWHYLVLLYWFIFYSLIFYFFLSSHG